MGKHNILNSVAAICVCLNLGIKIKVIKKALSKFTGVQRRMTKIFEKNKNEFYDDYAHHPTEIFSVLEGIKKVAKNKKITAVFQPHEFSRVNSLQKEFSHSFKYSDKVILCPVYPAGETIDKKFNLIKFGNMISKDSKVEVLVVRDEENLKKIL